MKKIVTDWVRLIVYVLLGVLLAAGLGLLVTLVQASPAFTAEPADPCDLQLRALERPPFRVNGGDLEDLARTVFAEARNQNLCGQIAVAFVAVNRVSRDPAEWGASVSAVVRQPRQFSPWTGARQIARLEALDELDPGYLAAHLAASLVLAGAVKDPTSGSTYFHTRDMTPPRWTKRLVRTVRIGDHIFYRSRS